jgi:hypothetical protein
MLMLMLMLVLLQLLLQLSGCFSRCRRYRLAPMLLLLQLQLWDCIFRCHCRRRTYVRPLVRVSLPCARLPSVCDTLLQKYN